MKVTTTPLKDCVILTPTLFEDHRGYFFESFNEKRFAEETGMDIHFVQDNQAKSNRGILRGLHFQQGEHARGLG